MRFARVTAVSLVGGALGAWTMGLAGFAPASAARFQVASPDISFASPATAGTVFRQPPLVVSGQVSRPGGFVDSVTIRVTWSDTAKGRIPGPHPPSTVTDNPDVREADAPWSLQPATPYNGAYTVAVSAITDGGTGTPQEQSSAASTFIADMAPATPMNVAQQTDTTQRIVHLTWTANTEPDLFGYEIIRAGPSPADAGHVIDGVTAPGTSYTDDQVATEPPGSYRYRVVAVRPNGGGDNVDLSVPSPEVATTFATPAKAVAPSPPATTIAPTGSSGPKGVSGSTGASGAAGVSGAGSPGSNNSTAAGTGAAEVAIAPRIVLPPASNSLPAYQALLNQARQTTVTTPPPEGGFSANLPYQPKVTQKEVTVPGVNPPAILGAPDQSGNGAQKTVEFLAAALILAVLAMFGLILKRSAEQATLLEALAPAGVPESRTAPVGHFDDAPEELLPDPSRNGGFAGVAALIGAGGSLGGRRVARREAAADEDVPGARPEPAEEPAAAAAGVGVVALAEHSAPVEDAGPVEDSAAVGDAGPVEDSAAAEEPGGLGEGSLLPAPQPAAHVEFGAGLGLAEPPKRRRLGRRWADWSSQVAAALAAGPEDIDAETPAAPSAPAGERSHGLAPVTIVDFTSPLGLVEDGTDPEPAADPEPEPETPVAAAAHIPDVSDVPDVSAIPDVSVAPDVPDVAEAATLPDPPDDDDVLPSPLLLILGGPVELLPDPVRVQDEAVLVSAAATSAGGGRARPLQSPWRT